jgi:hypothetical protein
MQLFGAGVYPRPHVTSLQIYPLDYLRFKHTMAMWDYFRELKDFFVLMTSFFICYFLLLSICKFYLLSLILIPF